MAEAIVSLAVRRISELLVNDAIFLNEVKEEVEGLIDQLKRMQCFLEDVHGKPEQDNPLRNRVSEIRGLAYDAEDVIDTFILKAAHGRGFHGIVKRFTCIFTKLSHLHNVKVQVKVIQTKLKSISESLPAYGISGDGVGSSSTSWVQQQLRRTYSHVEEEDAVSLEVSTKDVLTQLMTEEDRLHAVVSIVGMGGIGKTTLARRVYNHVDVKRHFDCLAWVSISQQWNLREILVDVLMKVQPGRESTDKLNETQLIKRLFDALKEKLYLVVLDDIWRSEDWDVLKPAFPRGRKGSKIIFTTRNRNVALHADPCNSPLELPLLTDEESWKLLRRKAFPRNKTDSHACSEEIEKLGREMVKQCGGLPLAIVVLGGLLATKQSVAQWKMVQRNIHRHLKGSDQHQDHQYGSVNRILVLSYNDLPYHLKPCFLYLSHYPEDCEFSRSDLIRLWIAEGFISPSLESKEILMEDVGEQFLEELINRSLVQVGRRDYTGTNAKTCRIHDLLRELCMEKAREENFLETVQPSSTELAVTLTTTMPRRVAMHLGERSVRLKGEHPKLRTLLLPSEKKFERELNISKCKSFKFLRVLNLVRRDIYRWRVSSEIGDLYHLRYLKLSGNVLILPRAIGKLKSLHTLNLQWVIELVIPNVLLKLERLRHIVFSAHPGYWRHLIRMHWQPRFRSRNIETLKYVLVDMKLIEDNVVLQWTNIKSLGVIFERSEHVKPIVTSLPELPRLESLLLVDPGYRTKFSYPALEALSQCHRLSKLKLEGQVEEEYPSGNHHFLTFLPPSIVKLTLWRSVVRQDPMGVLEKLPCLRILTFEEESYEGSKMICSANGFPQLHFL